MSKTLPSWKNLIAKPLQSPLASRFIRDSPIPKRDHSCNRASNIPDRFYLAIAASVYGKCNATEAEEPRIRILNKTQYFVFVFLLGILIRLSIFPILNLKLKFLGNFKSTSHSTMKNNIGFFYNTSYLLIAQQFTMNAFWQSLVEQSWEAYEIMS